MIIRANKTKVLSSKTIAEVMTHILSTESQVDQDKEHLWTVGLDGRNRIKYIDLVSLGTLTSSLAHPREIFRFAILQAVSAIILCHNHPSGDFTPSDDDRSLTERLRHCGDLIGIKLLDHVIIGDRGYWSFADKGGL